MSGGFSCQCPERNEPLFAPPGANRSARLWRVMQRHCNHSAFNGGRYTSSRYSSICCLRCGACWRSLSKFVDRLPDATPEDINMRPGVAGHAEAMTAYGRAL